jgi:hypothetical protein
MVEMGTYGELLISSSTFRHLLDNIHQQKQSEHSNNIRRGRSFDDMISPETENEGEQLLSTDDLEMKKEGTVKWYVYVKYLRASVGLTLGLIWLISILCIREATSVVASWWLAGCSEDESYRKSQFKNCTGTRDEKLNKNNDRYCLERMN